MHDFFGKQKDKGRTKWIFLFLIAAIGILLMMGTGEENRQNDRANSEGIDMVSVTEQKIREICEKVRGAGEATVAVTFSDSVSVFSDEPGLYEISGVGIVCDGGDDPIVVERLLSLVSAACDLPTSRIYIAPSENDN